MQHSYTQDTLVGLFVASGIAALFYMALQVSNLSSYLGNHQTYTISARFENTGGLKAKALVSIAGVKIGRVSAIHLDKETYESVVEMTIDTQYDTLPTDTSASIFTAGLLGEQYVSLDPGGSDEYLQDGDSIDITQSAVILEQVIGQFLFSKAADE